MSDAAPNPWLQLSLEAVKHTSEQLEDALLRVGAVAVTLKGGDEDAEVLEPQPGKTPLWQHTWVTGLFDAQTDIESVKRNLGSLLGPQFQPECRLASLEERDWVRAWLDDFHPMRFGRRLWVVPRGEAPPAADAVRLTLDPGLAFGSGTHPTTALCLEWLDAAALAGKRVIDYGCGSGILGIAAAILGATKVWAVDIDPQALMASDQNALINGVGDRVSLYAPEELGAAVADVVVANILAGPLIGLAARMAEIVVTGGTLVLSGVLADQVESVVQAYEPWFRFAEPEAREGWIRLVGTRQP